MTQRTNETNKKLLKKTKTQRQTKYPNKDRETAKAEPRITEGRFQKPSFFEGCALHKQHAEDCCTSLEKIGVKVMKIPKAVLINGDQGTEP